MLIALFYKFRPFFLTHALSNMDAKFGLQSRIQSLFPTTVKICPWRITKPKKYCSPYVHAFLNRQLNASIRSPSPESPTPGPSGNVYVDNWYDRLAINHLSQSLQAATGVRTSKNGYDGLVEVAAVAYRKFNPNQQRDVVIQSLEKAFPRPILTLIRTILPQSKFAREYFALFTTIFFAWLIGPCEVRESEFDGRKEKNVVHIKKCRFLEGTNCVGMCTSLCKMPSQIFIKDSLGMPLNMVPNFEDMSCEMIFGQQPPLPKDDPAFTQPCYIQCKENKRHSKNCPSQ